MPCLTPSCSHTFSCPEISKVSMEELFLGPWSLEWGGKEEQGSQAPGSLLGSWGQSRHSPESLWDGPWLGHRRWLWWGHAGSSRRSVRPWDPLPLHSDRSGIFLMLLCSDFTSRASLTFLRFASRWKFLSHVDQYLFYSFRVSCLADCFIPPEESICILD